MRGNKHLLLWSSLATLLVLIAAATQEHCYSDWRVAQRSFAAKLPPSSAAGFSVELRQIVSTDTGTTSRCVSCHVGMSPGEQAIKGDPVFGAHPDVVHEPARFGCTVCHGGQGLATSTADAHGAVPHWPEPMIPKRYAYAGCGTCHAYVAVPGTAELARGQALFERHDCFSCHRIGGRGGTLRPGGTGGQEGPDLSRIGAAGFAPDWYASHRAHAEAAAAGPWRTAFGEVSEADRDAIDVYLGSLLGAPQLVEAKALFHSLGCRGCHAIAGVGGDDGPDLTTVGQRDPALLPWAGVRGPRTLEGWFKEHFRNPARVVAGSKMPALGLDEAAIETVTFYMFSLRRADMPEQLWPRDRIRVERFGEREFAGDGKTLYGTFCAACHGPSGEGMRYPDMTAFPAIANPDFLAIASDEMIAATILRGRPGRRMPAWDKGEGGLRPADVVALIAALRELGGGVQAEPDPRPPRWAAGDATRGQALYGQACATCHGADGQGAEGPALHNTVLLETATDTYLTETIRRGRRGTSMPGFGTGSTVHRALADEEIEAIVSFLRTWESDS